jgi:hypothetical protein
MTTMSNHDHQNVATILEKINLLFRVFQKDGIDKISPIEQSLLLEQIDNLRNAVSAMHVQTKTVDPVQETHSEPVMEPQAETSEEAAPQSQNINEEVPQEFEQTHTEPVEMQGETPLPEPEVMEEIKEAIKSEEENVPVTPKPKTDYKVRTVRNMKEIIDLNMSFVFKGELFKGNIDAYNEFVSLLNEQYTEEEAFALVEQYALQLNWDKEEKVYALLLRAVEKRFLPILGI